MYLTNEYFLVQTQGKVKWKTQKYNSIGCASRGLAQHPHCQATAASALFRGLED